MPPKITVAPAWRAAVPSSYPRNALPVWMPMPTMSPALIVERSICSSVFVHDAWRTVRVRRGGGKHVQPPWRNDAYAKRHMARVHEVNGHQGSESANGMIAGGEGCRRGEHSTTAINHSPNDRQLARNR